MNSGDFRASGQVTPYHVRDKTVGQPLLTRDSSCGAVAQPSENRDKP